MNMQIVQIPVPLDCDNPSTRALLAVIEGLQGDNERLCFALFHCGQDIAEIENLTTTGKALPAKKTSAIFKLALAAMKHTK
jgi:hypothetical protein